MSKNLENLLSLAKALESPFFVGLVVINDRGEILLGKRKEDGKWTGPGGGADMGENPLQTARRELFEESAIVAEDFQFEKLCELRSRDKRPIYCFLVRLPNSPELSLQNDPDKEVESWGWFPLLGNLPEIKDPNRFRAILEAKLKVLGIRKSIVMNEDLPGYDLNTAEYSMDKLTADSPRIQEIINLMADFNYGELPRELILPNGYKLSLVQVDDGVFSGYVRRSKNDLQDANETALRIQKMPAPSIVQALDAKGYYASANEPVELVEQVKEIVEEHEAEWEGQEGTPAEQAADAAAFEQIEALASDLESAPKSDLQMLLESILSNKTENLHIHLHKSKELPVGTIRTWGHIQYQKISNEPGGWRPIPSPDRDPNMQKKPESKSEKPKEGEAASTKEKHTRDGKYTPERQKLHQQILEKAMKSVKPTPEGERPVAILTGGGSASGKSSVISEVMKNFSKDLVHVDADKIKEELPEYKEMTANKDERAAAYSHEESSHLTSEMIKQSVNSNKSFLYDSTFSKPEKFQKLVKDLQDKGYMVHVVFVDLPAEEAHKRAAARAAKTGRKVPKEIIETSHKGAIQTLNSVHDLPHSVSVYSNKGKKPELKFARFGNQRPVMDESHLEEMRQRGHLVKAEEPKMKKKAEDSISEKHAKSLIEKFQAAFEKQGIGEPELREMEDEGVGMDEYPGDLSQNEEN